MMESEMLYAGLRWPLAIIGLGQNYGLEHFCGSGRQKKRSGDAERTSRHKYETLMKDHETNQLDSFLFLPFRLESDEI